MKAKKRKSLEYVIIDLIFTNCFLQIESIFIKCLIRSKSSKSSRDCDSNFVKQFDHRSSNDFEENQSQSSYNSINDTLNRLKLSVEVYRIRTIE